MEPNDLELLQQARQGDRAALEALLDRHQRQVYRFGLKMCRDEEDAKDVVQETLLAMARNVRDFRGASSVSTWLYSIARSFCIKKRRRSKFAPEHEDQLTAVEAEVQRVADPGLLQDDSLAGRQIEAALERAIASLDPMYREILVLRDVEGLTAPEVAEVTGLTVEAVKSRLHRARLQVRELVAPLLGVPEPAAELADACPDVLDLFSRHLEGEISSDVCAEMEAHLARCGRCTARCASLQNTLLLCKRSPAPEVPAPVQQSVRDALRRFLADPASR
ncbi:MAG TPA: sigma-70 family RNA polymerase sigma factor [Anaeromyxobacteraceae bacterium]|nr:sigma-70 family RNA polymerase sigma factor [Anaeromyxobacteraceae bacterium]